MGAILCSLGVLHGDSRGAPVEDGASSGKLLGGPWGPSGGPRQSWGVRSGHFKALWGRMGLNKGAPGCASTDFGAFDGVNLYDSAVFTALSAVGDTQRAEASLNLIPSFPLGACWVRAGHKL